MRYTEQIPVGVMIPTKHVIVSEPDPYLFIDRILVRKPREVTEEEFKHRLLCNRPQYLYFAGYLKERPLYTFLAFTEKEIAYFFMENKEVRTISYSELYRTLRYNGLRQYKVSGYLELRAKTA